MKKIYLFCCMVFCCLSSYSQTLIATPETIENNGTVTLTGSGEFAFAHFGNITFQPGYTSTSSPAAGYGASLNLTNLQYTQAFNQATNAPSKFTFKISNSIDQNITATLYFMCTIINSNTGSTSSFQKSVTITIKPTVQAQVGNDAQSRAFTKNNCGAGFVGSSVTYSVSANKYYGSTKEEANAQAQNDINVNGQNYANTNGQCSQIYNNESQSGYFYKNDCSILNAGGPGPGVLYTIAANNPSCTSTISQQDANAKALSLLNTQGQIYANAHGQCSSAFTLDIVSQDSPADDSYQVGASPIITFKFINTQPSSGSTYELRVQSPSGDVTYGPQTLNRFRFKMNVAGQYIVSGRTVDASGTQSQWIDRFLIASN